MSVLAVVPARGGSKGIPHKNIKSRARRVTRPALDLPHTLATHGFPVTANDQTLAASKDRHEGERCSVIGNGPSLRTSALDRLRGESTFAANRI